MALVSLGHIRPPHLTNGTNFRNKETNDIVTITGSHLQHDGKLLIEYRKIGHVNQPDDIACAAQNVVMEKELFISKFAEVRKKFLWVDLPPRESDALKNDKYMEELCAGFNANQPTYMYGDYTPSQITELSRTAATAATQTATAVPMTSGNKITFRSTLSDKDWKDWKQEYEANWAGVIETIKAEYPESEPIDPVEALEAFKKNQ